MATRSAIGFHDGEHTIHAVYCHWDGYPTYVGAVLEHFYTDLDKIKLLIAGGDISSLGSEIGEKHDFDYHGNKVEIPNSDMETNDTTTYYHRDRDDEWYEVSPTESHNLENFEMNYGVAYYYIFKNGKWLVKRKYKNIDYITIPEMIELERLEDME